MAPLCGWRERPASLRMAWNETLASREHLVTFANGHPAFQMLLRPTNYDGEDNWRRLLQEQEYAYQVALLRTACACLLLYTFGYWRGPLARAIVCVLPVYTYRQPYGARHDA